MLLVGMESGNKTPDEEGGEGAKSDAAEPKAETSAKASGNSMTELKKNSIENTEQSKDNDGEGGNLGSASKEDPTHAEGDTGIGMPKNLAENESQQSQTGGHDSGEVDENKTLSENKVDSKYGDSNIDTDSNATVKQSSLPQAPIISESEEIDGKIEENAKMITGAKEADRTQNKNDEMNSSVIEGNDTNKEEAKGLEKEAEKIIGDVSLGEQKIGNILKTAESVSTKEASTTENECETKTGDKKSKEDTESIEEKKETVDAGRTETKTDESISTDKEKAVADTKEDAKAKVDTESTGIESDEKEEMAEKQEVTSMEIETNLVESNNVEADSDSAGKTPLIHVANNTGTNVEEQEVKDDTFEDFQKKRSIEKKKKKSQKRQSIKIKIAGMSTQITKIKMVDAGSSAIPILDKTDFALSCHDSLIPHDYNVVAKELEDSLRFFEQPHEDQDPTYTEFINKENRDRITMALKNLQVEEDSGKKEIAAIVNKQLKDKQGSTERYIEKHRVKIATDQKSDLTRLQQAYTTKARSNKGKIDHGVQVLRKKHSEENQKYLQQHRQQVRQRGVPEQIANAEWAQIASRLNAKHTRQMHDFSRKGKEVMNKYKLEYERERNRITKVYEKRLQDLNIQRKNLYTRIYSTLQQIQQRHLKKHLQTIAERRETMKEELADTENQPPKEIIGSTDPNKQHSPDKANIGKEERLDLRPVSPIKTATDWRDESIHEPSGAATRHKHRKGVLSQINRQLSVEIHNEGIWLSELSEKKNNQTKTKESSDIASTESDKKQFSPWGVKARKILESIVCGEIPFACDDSSKFNFSETVAQNGGHIRCVMTDLRTSDATASAQRAEAIMKKELDEVKKLEEKDATIRKNMTEMGKNMEIIRKQQRDLGLKLKETLKDYEKTKQHLQAFRSKYANFFGPGKFFWRLSFANTFLFKSEKVLKINV